MCPKKTFFLLLIYLIASVSLFFNFRESNIAVANIAVAVDPTQGPNNPAAVANDTSVGTIDWMSGGNVYTSSDTYTTVDLSAGEISHYLKITDFNFSIPAGTTINGIVVEIERKASGLGFFDLFDYSVKIVKGGVITGSGHGDIGTAWPTVDDDTYKTYGDATDLWGTAWTATDINSADFGVAISVKNVNPANSRRAFIDHVRVTVYYGGGGCICWCLSDCSHAGLCPCVGCNISGFCLDPGFGEPCGICCGPCQWPHVVIDAPLNVNVDQEFFVKLTYTHDASETGGIHLRWLDDKFDIVDAAGCIATKNPPAAPGWEGVECSPVNSGDTKTFKLKALVTGGQTLYYRAWDWTQDYDCGGGKFDYNRDPSSGSCSANCDPAGFPELWEVCDTYSKGITVTAPPPHDWWPHITYSCFPATVKVGEDFQCTQHYTHDMGSWGGINFNWLSEMADRVSVSGCIPGTESPPNTCLNINGIDCTCGDLGCYEVFECSVNHGDTVTLTLNAKKIGDLDVHHRAWDWSYDAVCPYPEVDRDPVSGTCSTNCDQFPDTDTIVCDKHTTTVEIKLPANDCDLLGGFCFLGHAPQCNLLCSPLSGDCYFTPEQCGTDCCCVCFLAAPVCGDGSKEAGEACDDGNTNNCDGCKGDCLRLDNVCGDGIAECGEECDDGNTVSGDGCSSTCKTECTPDDCNGNCPAGCGGADDPDCPGQCLDCTCATDTECTNKCTAGNGCCSGCTPIDPDCRLINPLICATFPECIEKIISFIFWVAMAIVPIMIIIAGFLFLTSGGDPEKVRTAKNIILYAVIGLTIILLAKGIISLIKTVIEG